MKNPVLKDYNLNETLLNNYYQEVRIIDNKYFSSTVYYSVFFLILFIFYIIFKITSNIDNLNFIFFYIPITGLLCFGIFNLVEKFLKQYLLFKKFGLVYKNIPKYETDKKIYQDWLYRTKISFWQNLSGKQFEKELSNLFEKQGYKVQRTGRSGDQGIDIILNGEIIVQCKSHKNKVSPSAIRDLIGTLQNSGFKKGILASTNGFSVGVYDYIKNNDIKLMTSDDYVKLQNKL